MINIFRLTHSMWPIHFRTAIENLLCSAVWNVECVCAEKDSAAGFCLCLTATSSRFLFWLFFLMCSTWPPVWTDIIIGIAKKINGNCYAERPRIIHLSCFTGKKQLASVSVFDMECVVVRFVVWISTSTMNLCFYRIALRKPMSFFRCLPIFSLLKLESIEVTN